MGTPIPGTTDDTGAHAAKPPPLASDSEIAATGASTAPNIHHRCANFALWALGTGVLLGILISPLSSAAQSPLSKMLTGGIPTVVMIAALPLGIIALLGIPRHGARGLLVKGLAGTIIPILLIGSAVFAFNRVRELSIVARAKNAAEEINQSAPKVIDEITKVERADFEPERKRFTLTISVALALEAIDRNAWDAQIVPQLRANFEKEGLAKLRDLGITVVYRYISAEGSVIEDIAFEPKGRAGQ